MAATLCLVVWLASVPPLAAASPEDVAQLTSFSLEELMDFEVTSVSKKGERLFAAAAAVFVITNEDIQRSGATTIPEALRMAPGLEVARIDGNKWAVTSRGFNSQFANKLLVLIDGRSVYTPLFSGIFWEVQDVMLEDVDRIEIIRGPGAALWGANAVNGVINIITRSSAETQGNLLVAGSGTEERAMASARTGGTIGDRGHYRAYVKYNDRDALDRPTGGAGDDRSRALRVGFRTDWSATDRDAVTVQGDYYDGEFGQTYTLVESAIPPFTRTFGFDVDVSGANVLARWTRTRSDTSDCTVQAYYDRTDRNDAFGAETRDTFDLDMQYRTTLGKHAIVSGLGYRRTVSDLEDSFTFTGSPLRRTDDLSNVFIHDDMTVRPDRLRLTLGAKLEHNDFTGVEFQPGLRLLWTPEGQHSVWAAASRAVRTPSRGESDLRIVIDALPPNTVFPGAPSALIAFVGNPNFKSEELHAFEVGYRYAWKSAWSVDVATFYNDYDSLISLEPEAPVLEPLPAPPHLLIAMRPENKSSGTTYGMEVVLDWQPLPRWRLHANVTTLQMDLQLDADSTADASSIRDTEQTSPRYQWYAWSSIDLPHDLDFDLSLRHVEKLPALGVDGYTVLDGRLAWRASPALEIELVGRNLTDRNQVEFVAPLLGIAPTVARRGVYASLNWSF